MSAPTMARMSFLVIPGGVDFLYPPPLATLSWLGGRIRRLCPRARPPAARAHKPAGQHPFLWVWPCLFLLPPLGFGNRGETPLGKNCSNPHSMQAMFQPL